MKNLIMIAMAFLTISATAQVRKNDGPKGDMKERREMRQEMTPEESAKLKTKQLTLELDLTDNQQVEVEKVLLSRAKTRKAKMEAWKAKKDKAEGEKPSKEDRLKMANERLDHQIEIKRKMKAILNADQYAKLEKIQKNRKDERGKHAIMRKHRD